MPIRYPVEFSVLTNFEVAWERIVRGSNTEYKTFFSYRYSSYRFGQQTILEDLLSEFRGGRYRPSPATAVYFPKATRILRPITLLSLNDQVVYQAIANVVANRFYASLTPYCGTKTFGALYGGRNSLFFYRPWKKAYRTFNSEIRQEHKPPARILHGLVQFENSGQLGSGSRKKAHSEAQRRSNLIRGGWKGNPSFLITVLDNFNDLLIQRLSVRHAQLRGAFRKASGLNKIPDFGNWLRHPDLARVLPASHLVFGECHRKRLVADVAHATIKKTGKFTRPLGYKEAGKVIRGLRHAYSELLTEFGNL